MRTAAEVVESSVGLGELVASGVARQLLYSSWIFAGVALLTWLLRKRAPAWRYALWSLVLLRLLLPPDLAFPYSARQLWQQVSGPVVSADDLILDGWQPKAAALPLMTWRSEQALGGSSESSRWWPLVAGLWLLGELACLLGFSRRRARYLRLGRLGEDVQEPSALAVLDRWRELFGVRRRVLLVRSVAALQPFTFGLWRPRIVVPERLLEDGHESLLDAVLGHEMAHVRRLDDGWLCLHQLVRALYFFHPVAWLTVARLAEERELICDRMVLAAGRLDPRTYGRALVQVLSWNPSPVPAAAGLGSSHRRLTMRIRRLLDHDAATATADRRTSLLRQVAVALAAVFLLPLAGDSAEVPLPAADCQVPGQLRTGEVAGGARWLAHPLPGARVTSEFGPREHPFLMNEPRHHGIDFVGADSQPVQAPLDGVIELSTTAIEGREYLGTVVVVDHGGGLRTLYAHLDRALVQTGDRVEPGDLLGFPGATGKVTGPHLHFEVLYRGEPVNPDFWIRREDC